jgi:PKHD-type hydroxylase
MYKLIKNLICETESKRLSDLVRIQPLNNGDPQVPNSCSYYNLPCMNILLGLLRDGISDIYGKEVVPSYSFCRLYKKGSKLVKHVDRDACEVSVTINLSQSHPWPIYMEGSEFNLSIGDAVLYEGRTVEHWRDSFEGDEYIQVFLHYVSESGPFKDHAWDFKKIIDGYPIQFRYRNRNDNLTNWWRKFGVFTPEECENILGSVIPIENGRIGDVGGLDKPSERVSMVGWLPKISEWNWVYSRLASIVSEVNDSFFKFDITGLDEEIQLAEYGVGGHYNWHTDIGGEKDFRKISISVQLSDPTSYDGGRLQFDEDDEASTELGAVVAFPSYKRHRVTPVTRGKRCALVLWVTGPPFR